jgi:general stress protein YciG
MADVRIPKDVMEFFRKTGSMGGKARASKHSKEQLSEWARMGGRPKGSGKVKDTKNILRGPKKAKGGS